MKKIISLILLLCFVNIPVYAVSFDTSVDADIRKEYKIESNDLPPLPSTVPTANTVTVSSPVPTPKYNPTGKIYTIANGTKITLNSKTKISDSMQKGSKITFSTKNGFTTKEGEIIPAGTIFKGTIVDSHTPQLTGNGGLIEIKIDEAFFNGIQSQISTKVALAGSKKVFKSDIKGQRKFWKNTANAMKFGKKTFNKTHKISRELSSIPVVNLLSPVVWCGGAVIYVLNIPVAPVISVFKKGGNVSLPIGTEFIIKINGDNQIKG